MITRVLGVLCFILLAAVVFLWTRRDKEAEARVVAELRADSAQAAADTLRKVVIPKLNDSLQAVTQRVIQTGAQPSEATRSSGQRAVASTAVSASMKEVSVEFADVTVVGDTGIREFHEVRETNGVMLALHGQVPPAPRTARIVAAVNVKPFTIGADVICGPQERTGIRKANVMITAPSHLVIENVRSSQQPGVCNPITPASKRNPWYKPRLVVSAGYGWTLTDEGTGKHEVVKRGPQLHVGLGVGIPLF